MKVVVLGAGLMGSALVKSLVVNKYDVMVWNRTKEKAQPLSKIGARIANSVEEALNDVDIVIANLRDSTATEAVLNQPNIAPYIEGKIIVELASGSPKEAREAKKWVEKVGATYLDGAILATPDLIGTEEAAIVISGEYSEYEKSKAVLSTLGSIIHVGNVIGNANAIDLASLSIMWGSLFGAAHAVAVCEAEEISMDLLREFWKSSAPVVQFMVDNFIERNASGRLESDEESIATIATHYGAMKHLASVMEDKNLDTSILDGYKTIFQKADTAGKLTSDFAVISHFMKK